jgi:hypothetical protein
MPFGLSRGPSTEYPPRARLQPEAASTHQHALRAVARIKHGAPASTASACPKQLRRTKHVFGLSRESTEYPPRPRLHAQSNFDLDTELPPRREPRGPSVISRVNDRQPRALTAPTGTLALEAGIPRAASARRGPDCGPVAQPSPRAMNAPMPGLRGAACPSGCRADRARNTRLERVCTPKAASTWTVVLVLVLDPTKTHKGHRVLSTGGLFALQRQRRRQLHPTATDTNSTRRRTKTQP